MSDPYSPDDDANRDPGATQEEAGIPEIADDLRPTDDIPEPEARPVPVDAPTPGLFRVEEERTLDDRLAEEVPDDAPATDETQADVAGDGVTGMHIETEPDS
ncbi:hypothetical protein [Jiangella rhizosphaerae]|uniref:DUF5709 domain-containing protein n=1 Tax=Jiangella rhizosphaerae TaxID=2293569 RepID=A0A418KS17_9ACTN|nr:hypothetical protein [Jiangella rhizosphaerae]RIQ26288.1 hypothetical protein DY240_10565 [Jiangella rhizosphaerae]